MQLPCTHNIREVVLGASNRKLSVSCDNIPNDLHFPSECFLLLDMCQWQQIIDQGKDKENIQHCLNYRKEAERAQLRGTGPALAKDIFHLLFDLI